MNRLVFAVAFAVACATAPTPVAKDGAHNAVRAPSVRFIPLDHGYSLSPHGEPAKVLVDDKEIAAEPPFKVVGVVEIEGKETEQLAAFVARAEDGGASAGCDVLVERDAFELGTRVQRPSTPVFNSQITRGMLGRDWQRNDQVVWQFLCGVNGASDSEQAQTLKRATSLAVDLRRKELGNYEPCEPYTPTGSRIRRTRVCADDPAHHSEADARSSGPSY
ncbi:MAG TPA: hypothetical protein VGH20_15900 [Myxococcales bacterium]|jgi:hypothetical protein